MQQGQLPPTVDELFALHRPFLERIARSWGRFLEPEVGPEDLLGDLYLQLRHTFGNDASEIKDFRAYSSAVLRHLFSRRRSSGLKRYLRQVSIEEAHQIAAPAPLMGAEDLLLFESALKTLEREDPSLSEVISLRFLMGFSDLEVGAKLQKTPEWVRNASKRATKRLRILVEGEEKRSERARGASEDRIILPRPSDIQSVTLELVDAALIARLAQEPDLMKTLDWRAFEYLLARVLEELEYEIELTRGTKDGGVDIFAIKRSGPFGIHKYLLQAKRWSRVVGVEPVRELLFLHDHYRVTKSCLATTSRFTHGAWELAREYKWTLELKDYEGLREWVKLCVTPHPKLGN